MLQKNNEVAMRRIGDSHNAEHQRLAHREQCVEAAKHDALQKSVDPTNHVDSFPCLYPEIRFLKADRG
ncbi:hypothetical protein ACFS07_33545 [Undibacterium arcticum]